MKTGKAVLKVLSEIGLWIISRVAAYFAIMIALGFVVVSLYYYFLELGNFIYSGRLITIAESDCDGAKAIYRETILFWISIAVWVIIGSVYFYLRIQKYKKQNVESCKD